ncbi:hypothetical protein ACJJTC_005968, partial [Scirpophaga incertulas]
SIHQRSPNHAYDRMIQLYLVSFLSVILAILYSVIRERYKYWKKRNVIHPDPRFLLGNYNDFILMRKNMSEVLHNILKDYPDEPYIGVFYGTEPTLLVQDPEIVKLITTKDFYYFHGREATNYVNREGSTQNLFFDAGDRWKVTRQNLSPLFSTAKMKKMFPLIEQCCHQFERIIDEERLVTNDIEVRTMMARFTIACICSCAFGVDVDTLAENYEQNPFFNIGHVIFDNTIKRTALNIMRAIWPAVFYALGYKIFPTDLEEFFKSFLTKIFEGREYKPTNRHDFIDMVLRLKEKNIITGDSIKNWENMKIQLPVTDQFMIAQCMLFFGAGFETSAATLGYTLYELAKHPNAQRKAHEDIDEFMKKHQNKLVYECISELPYVEMCVDETLRLYPALGVVMREIMEDYVLPSGLKLSKGLRVHLPLYHIHRHPKYFPEPEKFRPERFSPEERNNITSHSYVPFGGGPRICIGMRFAKMQMLAGLVTILKKYDVALAEGMPEKLQFDPRAIVTQPIGGINLKFTPREGWENRMFAKD